MKKKLLVLPFALCMALFLMSATAMQAAASSGAYIGNGSDWCSALFDSESTKYDKSLALVAAEMSEKIESEKSDAIEGLYRSYGLYDCKYGNFGGSSAYAIGQDTLTVNGIDTTILVITARGTKTIDEMIGDVCKGGEKDFLGTKVWKNVYDFEEELWKGIDDYVNMRPILKSQRNLKILVTGHSLGGTAANMAGARFTKGISGKEWWSYHVKKDDIYVYTFGAIKVLNEKDGETKENISNGYENIHNIYNYYDSYGPNGNQKGTNASSINAKFGHTELYKFQSKENGTNVWSSCNSHLMSNYKEAIQNPEKSKLEIKCKATYPEISMNTSEINLKIGDTFSLKAFINRRSLKGKTILWNAGNSAIATVDGKGTVKAVKKGTVTITANIKGTNYQTDCKITVKQAETKEKAYREQADGTWSNGKNIIYSKGYTLYKTTENGETEIIADFSSVDDYKYSSEFYILHIVAICDNYAFVQKKYDVSLIAVYSVNIKTGEKTQLGKTGSSRPLELICCGGKYIYGYRGSVGRATSSDVTLPANIYKPQKGNLKKIKTLGKHIRDVVVYRSKLYYASYTTKSQMTSKEMVVYSCELDGRSKKKLFTMKSKSKEEYLRLAGFKKGKIFAERWHPSGSNYEKYYMYSTKNKKLKKIKRKDYRREFHLPY